MEVKDELEVDVVEREETVRRVDVEVTVVVGDEAVVRVDVAVRSEELETDGEEVDLIFSSNLFSKCWSGDVEATGIYYFLVNTGIEI